MKKTPSTIQLSRLKSAAKSVNYRQGFWSGYLGDILKKLSKVRVYQRIPSLKGRFSYKVGWRDVIIALLLGLLLAKSAPTHIVRSQIGGFSPAPAIFSVKPLPLLKEASYKPVGGLDVVYVSKLRPYGTYPNGFAPFNCTQYVASRLPIPETWGNAGEWGYHALMDGYTVSAIPKVGSVATNTTDSSLGHVAIVGEIANGMVRLEEQNYEGPGVISTDRWAPISQYSYIYV